MTYNATYFNTGGTGKSYFINQLAVSEITLSTSGMSAETASGGVSLNVVPKDGGNSFRVHRERAFHEWRVTAVESH